MRKEILFSMESPYRDTFKIYGYRFGRGEQTLAIVGAMRGDEVHQQYICSQIVRKLEEYELQGLMNKGFEVMVIPSANPFSMNIGKRFWAMDNTDINRMFPGYYLGETTQRIAAGLFEKIKDFEYGVQFASYYLPGEFIPHVRMLKTDFSDVESAKQFGFPIVSLHTPSPFDTTTLNYNWQIWDTKAFSIYGGQNNDVSGRTTLTIINNILHFMQRKGILNGAVRNNTIEYNSNVIDEDDLIRLKASTSGFFERVAHAGDEVSKGDLLANIIDPYEGKILSEIKSPVEGVIFYALNQPTTLQGTQIFRIQKF